jgi:hypothetical protein
MSNPIYFSVNPTFSNLNATPSTTKTSATTLPSTAGLPDLFPLVTPPHISTPHGASRSCFPSKLFSRHGTSVGCKRNQYGLPSTEWVVTASCFYNVISISLSLSFFHGGWVDLGDDFDGFCGC